VSDSPLAPFKDILGWFPTYKPDVIIDVGANVGNFTVQYANTLPGARIYSFEPHPVTFDKLEENTQKYPNVTPVCCALSDRQATLRMTDVPLSTANRVTKDGALEVEATTLSVAMDDLKIDHASYLKVDAEAHDLEVLKGAPLDRIDFVQVETMLNKHDPQGTFFVPVFEHMTSNGFYLFNVYDFLWEWKRGSLGILVSIAGGKPYETHTGAPIARRVDTVFINQKLVGELS
jgi:FkbM family methyltransferase